MSCGVTLTEQTPADPVVSVTLDKPVTHLSKELLEENPRLWDALVRTVRDVACDKTPTKLTEFLEDHEIETAYSVANLPGLIQNIARGDRDRMYREFCGILPKLGHGCSPTEDVYVVPRLLGLSEETHTVSVRLTDEFWELKRDQRVDLCRYVNEYATGCDVRLVGTGRQQRRLVEDHRKDVCVSREDITPPSGGPMSERVEKARETLDRDGREVQVLRWLAGEDSETLSYNALDSRLSVSTSRRSQCLSTLREVGLVDTFGPRSDKHVELLPAGREYLDWLDEEIARQRTLEESVSGVSNTIHNSRVSPPSHGKEGEAADPDKDRKRLPDLHQIKDLSQWEAVATSATTPENGVSVVNYPVEKQDDRGSPRLFCDYAEDRLVVGAEYDNPMQYWVCVARALASGKTWSAILDDGDRLDDSGKFHTFLSDHKHLLRDSRCLGYLPDRVEDGRDYRDELLAAEKRLCQLTHNLRTEEYDGDEAEYRGVITREALGLAGVMVHLLDLVGVDVVRQVRVPTYNRHFDTERREALLESIATGVAIQSKYGESTVYRQLYETREDKRQAAIEPTIDAEDPFGELIGSFCILGDFRGKLGEFTEQLRERLASPGEVHEDAPELAVRVPVRSSEEFGRTVYARTVERMCREKNLSPTREAVSVFRLFTGTPFDVAAALGGLGSEDVRRDIRLGEVRYGLAKAPKARVVPWETSGVRALVRALLTASEPLSVSELADRAGVGRQTWYNNRDRLGALDLVRETEDGVRLALPFHETERHEDVRPWYTRPDGDRDDLREATIAGVVMELASLLERPDNWSELQSAMRWPPDPEGMGEAWPWVRPWIRAFRVALPETETEWSVAERQEAADPVVFGNKPCQASVREVVGA